MTQPERREAVEQLASRLRLLHSTPAPELPPLRDLPQLLEPAGRGIEAVAPLIAGLRRAAGLPRVDAKLMVDLEALVESSASAIEPFDAPTLVHGDLTFENVLWDPAQHRVTALLDFEWARQGPADLDLDVLLRCVAYPKLHVAADYEHLTRTEDYADVPRWLSESYPELFSFPRQLERVRLYAIAWDVRELLRFPPSVDLGELHQAHPYRRLVRTMNSNSYLDTMHGSVPVPGT
jgi:Ser/Thr protein kinase RdoA (MazF antagonist)